MKTFSLNVRLSFIALLVAASLAPLAAGATQPQPAGNIVIWGFGGTFDQAMQTAVIQPFEKLYPNITVTIAPGANSAAHLTALEANKGHENIDVDLIGGGLWLQAIQDGLYQKLNMAQVPNFKNVYPQAQVAQGYGPSIAFSGVGLAYNTDKISSAPKSWNDLFNPNYKGHVGIPNLDNNAGLMLLVKLAKMNSGSAQKIDPGFAAMQKLKQAVSPIFFSLSGDEQNQFANGNMWIAPMFDSQAHLLAKGGLHIGFVYPKEGGFVTQNVINVVAGTKYPDAANAFINYFLNAYTQDRWSQAVLYGPTVHNTKLPTSVQDQVIYGPDNVKHMYYAPWGIMNLQRAAWTDRWNREILS